MMWHHMPFYSPTHTGPPNQVWCCLRGTWSADSDTIGQKVSLSLCYCHHQPLPHSSVVLKFWVLCWPEGSVAESEGAHQQINVCGMAWRGFICLCWSDLDILFHMQAMWAPATLMWPCIPAVENLLDGMTHSTSMAEEQTDHLRVQAHKEN